MSSYSFATPQILTAIAVGSIAVGIYVYRKRSSASWSGRGNASTSSTSASASLVDCILPLIIKFIRNAQPSAEARASVDTLLFRYYTRWYDAEPPGSSGFVDGNVAITNTTGDVATVLLEGLGTLYACASDEKNAPPKGTSSSVAPQLPGYSTSLFKKNTRGYHYISDFSLPIDLTEKVLASVSLGPVRDAFRIAQLYLEICSDRRRAASEGKTASEEECTALLKTLWEESFSSIAAPSCAPLFEREGEGWKDLGFQGRNPVTDLRGGGIMSLEDYVYFAKHNKALHAEMIAYSRNQHETNQHSWFLEACVSIQLSVQLTTSALDAAQNIPTATPPSTGNRTGGLLKKINTTPSSASSNTSPLRFTAPIISFLYNSGARDKSTLRIRLQTLHSLFFQAFFTLWKREQPHVMQYQPFMDSIYYIESPLLIEQYLKEAGGRIA